MRHLRILHLSNNLRKILQGLKGLVLCCDQRNPKEGGFFALQGAIEPREGRMSSRPQRTQPWPFLWVFARLTSTGPMTFPVFANRKRSPCRF